jgi:hypothetical protein
MRRFWAALLDAEAVDRDLGWSEVRARGLPTLSFRPVPDPRRGKNRLKD